MGKKGSWFSAIKRAFTHNSKEKQANGSDKKSSSKENKGKGFSRRGETKSFISRFREPSSIEKILAEADQLLIRPPTPLERPKSPPSLPVRPVSPRLASPKAASPRVCSPRAPSPQSPSPRAVSPKAPSPKSPSPRAVPTKAAPLEASTSGASSSSKAAASEVTQKEVRYERRAEPTLQEQQHSATKIQAACRGYLARRSFRSMRGLVRLQAVVKGQNTKRQTVKAMKQMQLLVRVQTQIQSRRIQMLENPTLPTNDKEAESTQSKMTLNQLFEAGQNDDWDDSSLTKEEADARRRNKVEAVIKRERAMAYSYSHKLWKSNPRSAQTPPDIRSNAFPWRWNWLERHLPKPAPRNTFSTPPRPSPHSKPTPTSSRLPSPFNTPRSAKSAIPFRAKQFQTTPSRTPLKDDDSLVSCPPFSVPNYMAPTASAKAKARANSNPRERFPVTPGSDLSRRFSFPFSPNVGSFKWSKGSNGGSPASRLGTENRSIGDFSVDSTASMPVGLVGRRLVGRRSFNRFV